MASGAGSVLVVDPDEETARSLVALLGGAGIATRHVRSGPEAIAALEAEPFDVVVTDAQPFGMEGIELLDRIVRGYADVAVVMTARTASVSLAVEAMRAGAADFVAKPFDRDEILWTVRKLLVAAERAAREAAEAGPSRARLLGEGRAIRKVLDLVARTASGTATVLVRGESGTGKELVARAIHDESPRATGPFVKIHCAALPDTLLESELFGYEKGAFTGAASRKPGRVELAQGGTLFLDEIGDVTPAIQVKLLRLLQDREFERLGGTEAIRADVRFVAATHRDLETMVEKGEFRQDLFYRLNVVPLWLPPLRARREDIDALAREFCRTFAKENGRPELALDDGALELLRRHRWPGNVRQLQNFVERLVVLATGAVIRADDVKHELSQQAPFQTQPASVEGAAASASGSGGTTSIVGPLDEELRRAERRALVKALERAAGNRTVAAKILGVSRRTLYYKLEEHGIS